MDFEDYLLTQKGFNDKWLIEQSLLRRVAFVVASGFQKGSVLERMWPDPLKPKQDLVLYKGSMMTKRQAQRLAEQLKTPTGRNRLTRKKQSG